MNPDPRAEFERGVLTALSYLTEAVRIIERRLTSGEYDDSGLWQVDDAVRKLERLIDGSRTLTEKDLRDCFERENGYPLSDHSDGDPS